VKRAGFLTLEKRGHSIARVSAETTSSHPPKKTPLFDAHVAAGGKMVDFGGWNMPVQYSGILDEHHAVRHTIGVFDISHMGEVFVSGPQAKAWLNHVLTNNVERLGLGECQYTFLLNEQGGVIDDLLVYQLEEASYLLVVNASTIDEDVAWLQSHLTAGVTLENRSDEFAGLAVQGPLAAQLFDRFFEGKISRPARNEIQRYEADCTTIWIARTGYTGEDGFELFFQAQCAPTIWNAILEKGADLGIKPCGLGARDTLRLEMCYPLNGSDLSPQHTPLEAGLSFFVDLEKTDFIGRAPLAAQREKGVPRRLVPFKMKGKTPPPRSHYRIFKNGQPIAETTSGTVSPSMGIGIGMAYIPSEFARINEEIEIDIRGRRFPATIEKKPLHKK
jgi:aminomethyltransferase